uniref:hypothetical protein n=1 Tax=Azospirillum argentinense TaxID=2970906 RepID=UPI0015864BB6|nr:hypothetical protein [Azospirillum argentinense]
MPLHHFAALTVINFLSFAIDCPDEFLGLELDPYMERFGTLDALNILSAEWRRPVNRGGPLRHQRCHSQRRRPVQVTRIPTQGRSPEAETKDRRFHRLGIAARRNNVTEHAADIKRRTTTDLAETCAPPSLFRRPAVMPLDDELVPVSRTAWRLG